MGRIGTGPPLLTAKSCKFSRFWAILATRPLFTGTRPPLFTNPGSGLANNQPTIGWHLFACTTLFIFVQNKQITHHIIISYLNSVLPFGVGTERKTHSNCIIFLSWLYYCLVLSWCLILACFCWVLTQTTLVENTGLWDSTWRVSLITQPIVPTVTQLK